MTVGRFTVYWEFSMGRIFNWSYLVLSSLYMIPIVLIMMFE